MKQQRGISLLEVSLAVSVGLMLTVGGAYAYRQHAQSVRITEARLMLETMRTNIQRYQVLNLNPANKPPTLATLRGNSYPVSGSPRGFYGPAGSPYRDPLYPRHTDSAKIEPLGAGPAPPWGGWRYNETTGELRINANPADFPGQNFNAW